MSSRLSKSLAKIGIGDGVGDEQIPPTPEEKFLLDLRNSGNQEGDA